MQRNVPAACSPWAPAAGPATWDPCPPLQAIGFPKGCCLPAFVRASLGGGGGTNARPWRERASARQMPEPCRIGPREKQSVNLQSSAQCENEKESSALSPHVRCPRRLERLKSVSLNCLPIAVDYLKGCCSLSRAERKDMAVRQIQLTERLRPQSHPRTRTATRNASSLPGRSGRARNAAQLRTVQVSQAAQGRRRNAICEASAKGWGPPPPWGVGGCLSRARESAGEHGAPAD